MMGWLFKTYDRGAFGLFRFTWYLAFLCFYHYTGAIFYESWLAPDFKAFFSPISFFSFFNFQDLTWLSTFDGLKIWKISMIMSALGILFPFSSVISFLGLAIFAGLPLNFGKIHHINHLPVVLMGIMALSFTGGAASFDSWIVKKLNLSELRVTKWPLQCSRIYMCSIYCASGIQKLLNAGLDWIFSDNMQMIILTRPTVTEFGSWIAEFPLLCQSIALITVVAQVCAPLALISLKSRYLIIPVLFLLHIGTYLTLGDHGYFFPYNLCFLVWLPWERMNICLRSITFKFKSMLL